MWPPLGLHSASSASLCVFLLCQGRGGGGDGNSAPDDPLIERGFVLR